MSKTFGTSEKKGGSKYLKVKLKIWFKSDLKRLEAVYSDWKWPREVKLGFWILKILSLKSEIFDGKTTIALDKRCLS